MARKKAAAKAAEPVDVCTLVDQWFKDAHAAVKLCRWLAQYRDYRTHYSVRITDELEQVEHHHRIESLFDAKRNAREVIADQLLHHSEQLLADLGSLQVRLRNETLDRLFTVAYAAIGEDFSYGGYPGGLFAWQVLCPFGYDMRRWTLELSVFWKHTRDHLDIELEQQYRDHCERCPFETGIDYALNKRLTLEHSQITRDLATIHGKQVAATNPPKKTNRKDQSSEPFKRTQQELVYEFLKLWHRYGQTDRKGKDLFQNGPVGLNDLAKFAREQSNTHAPSKATISRWFRQHFDGHKQYEIKCRLNNIEAYFQKREGEKNAVYQSDDLTTERSDYDEEMDLD